MLFRLQPIWTRVTHVYGTHQRLIFYRSLIFCPFLHGEILPIGVKNIPINQLIFCRQDIIGSTKLTLRGSGEGGGSKTQSTSTCVPSDSHLLHDTLNSF